MTIFQRSTCTAAVALVASLCSGQVHATDYCNSTGACIDEENTNTSFTAIGVLGRTMANGTDYGTGVWGESHDGTGMYGKAYNSGTGVIGESATGGNTIDGIGVWGVAHGVLAAVRGDNDSSGSAVAGYGTSGYGVYGNSSTNIGMFAYSTYSHGLYAQTNSYNARAVFGYNSSSTAGGVGVWGEADATSPSVGVYGMNSNSGGWAGYFNGNLGVTGIPRANQTTFSSLSDVRLKKNVKPLAGALEKLLQLRGVTYEWKEPAEHGNLQGTQVGFVAQEVEKVFPSWVSTDPSGFKAITTRGLEAMTVESLRSLQAQNDELRARVKALESGRVGPTRAAIGFDGWSSGALLLVGGIAVFASRRRSRAPRA
jgi:hypothetical protein